MKASFHGTWLCLLSMLSASPALADASHVTNGPWVWQQPLVTGDDLFSFAQAGAGGPMLLVGNAGAVLRSTDGVNWMPIRTLYADYNTDGVLDDTTLYAVTHWNGLFIAGGEGHILTSSDGRSWTAASLGVSSGTPIKIAGFASNGSVIVANSTAGTQALYISNDGQTWKPDGAIELFGNVQSLGGVFYAVIFDRDPSVTAQELYSSTDGQSWHLVTSFPGSTADTIASSGATLLVTDFSGKVYSTTDGTHWSAPAAYPFGSNRLQWTGREFAMMSGGGPHYYTSSDGSAWATHALPVYVNYVSWTGSRYVAFGNAGAIDTSPDGDTWTGVSTPGTASFRTVIWDGLQFLIYGQGPQRSAGDGTSWTSAALTGGGVGSVQGVVKGSAVFLAADDFGEIQVSADGLAWTNTTVSIPHGYFSFAQCGSKAVAVSNANNITSQVWVATSDSGSNYLTWTENLSPFNRGPLGVACGNGVFVTAFLDSVATSSDGLAWKVTKLQSVAGALELTVFKFLNGNFTAVGMAGEIFTSTDGFTWTRREPATPQAPPQLSDLTWDGNEYIGVSNATDGPWTTPDLANWYQDVRPQGILGAGLGAGGGHALIVGSNGAIVESIAGTGLAPSMTPASAAAPQGFHTSASGQCAASDPQGNALVYQPGSQSLTNFYGQVTVDSLTGAFTASVLDFDLAGDPLQFVCRASNGYMISAATITIDMQRPPNPPPPPAGNVPGKKGGGEQDLLSLCVLAWLWRKRGHGKR